MSSNLLKKQIMYGDVKRKAIFFSFLVYLAGLVATGYYLIGRACLIVSFVLGCEARHGSLPVPPLLMFSIHIYVHFFEQSEWAWLLQL